MDVEQTRAEDTVGVAGSGDESDTRHASTKNSALPTESMDNVSLSEVPLTPVATHSDEDDDTATVLDEKDATLTERVPSIRTDDGVLSDPDSPEDVSEPDMLEHRQSSASTASIREDASLSTTRSRSDSSGTLSSTHSVQVDWVELDRSEEQAPRDEASDEVSTHVLAYQCHSYSLNHRLLHFYSPGWSRRITAWLQIPKQV